MSRTYKQPGRVVMYANTGAAISAGDVVVMGDIVGIALVDIATNESGSVSIEAVHEVPKNTATAWAQGEKIDWDASAGEFRPGATPAAGDVLTCGIAVEDEGAPDLVGLIRLTPGTGAGQ